jgi:ABC-2 type transport system ATP-binding protein
VLERHGAVGIEIGNPRTTLEDLFLDVVRDTEARPGRRARRGADSPAAE